MAEVHLIFKPTRAQIDAIKVDVSLSEQHQSEVEITEHPVETGTNIIDHARPKPDMLTIEGVISNDPMPEPTAANVAREHKDVKFMSHSASQAERAGKGYKDLIALKDATKLITVVTALVTYENMMLRSLSVPRDPRTGQALRFSATFVQVRVVSSKTVELKAEKQKSGGKKATPAASEALKAKAKDNTFALDVYSAFGGR